MPIAINTSISVPFWFTMPVNPAHGQVNRVLSATRAWVGAFLVPFRVSFTMVTYRIQTPGTSGVRLAIYDMLGNRLISLSDVAQPLLGNYTLATQASFAPGMYYAAVCDDGTGTHPQIKAWSAVVVNLLTYPPYGEPGVEGYVNLAPAGILPSTFNPLGVGGGGGGDYLPILRFDS